MIVGFLQFSPVFNDKKANIKKIEQILERDICKDNSPDLIVLPELALSGYAFSNKIEIKNVSDIVPGETTDYFITLAKKYNTNFVLGFAEKNENNIYNSAALITKNEVKSVYRKAHLFYKEKNIFDKSSSKFTIIDLNNCKVGLLVCFDHMFPEAARALALKGAQVICHPSNLVLKGYAQLTTRVRSIENKVFWILANRIGTETLDGEKLQFTGCSQITDPSGKIILSSTENEEVLKCIKIDPLLANNKNINQLNNVLNDRRVDLY